MSYNFIGSVKHAIENSSSFTYLEVFISDDVDESITIDPANVTEILATTPTGDTYTKVDFTYYHNSFWVRIAGAPDLGDYSFSLTMSGITYTDTDTQTVILALPLPTINPVSISGQTATFSWSLIPGYRYNICISDGSGNMTVHPRVLDAVTDSIVLSPGTYYWRLIVSEDIDFKVYNNRIQTEWMEFIIA